MHPSPLARGAFLLWAVTLAAAAAMEQDTGVLWATVGDNVTLHCVSTSAVVMFYSWYRQSLGGRPEFLFSVYKYSSSDGNQALGSDRRFSLNRKEGGNHLHIANVRPADSATYFCGASHANIMEFGPGVFLSVQALDSGPAPDKQQGIVQAPASETVSPGGWVNLSCAVRGGGGANGVYWFRAGGSEVGLLQAHGDRCGRPAAPGSASRGCAYHLHRTGLGPADAGTYRCAVATCGRVLFGNGSRLLVDGRPGAVRVLVWLSIIRTGILALLLSVSLLVFLTKRRR